MTLRKLRFPILIGCGVLAAAGLIYFSKSRIASHETQGAIGQRDVYRDAQANGGDIGTPGSAPVAVTAVLQSREFRSLAKNQAFQNLLASQAFQSVARDQAFVNLLANSSFQGLVAHPAFVQLLQSASFQQAAAAMRQQMGAGPGGDRLIAGLRQDSNFQALENNAAFNSLLRNAAFLRMASSQAFANLVSAGSFQSLVKNESFVALVHESQFQNALLQGSAANLSTAARAE